MQISMSCSTVFQYLLGEEVEEELGHDHLISGDQKVPLKEYTFRINHIQPSLDRGTCK